MQDVDFDGTRIFGTSYYTEDFTEFNSDPSEQNGFYLALNVTEWNGAKFRIDRINRKGTEVAFNGDGIAVLFLGATEKDAKTAKYFVYVPAEGEETAFSLDLNFEEKEQ